MLNLDKHNHTIGMPPSLTPNPILSAPQALSVGAGWDWLVDAWQIFKRNMGLWIAVGLINFFVTIILGFIPVIGAFTGALNAFFMAGVAYMAHQYFLGNQVKISDLFIGFRKNALQLLLIFVFAVIAIVVIVFAMLILGSALGVNSALLSVDNAQAFPLSVILLMLITIALFIPITMAMWFAPILVILNNKSAIEAMKLSFSGCLKNIFPFIWYSIILVLCLFVALLPVGLGVLVFIPVVMISCYTGYRQIFT